jgi:broad specificity phosphatase PhoE
MTRIHSSVRILVLALLVATAASTTAAATDLLALLGEGRAVALIRHANAPGVGDPPGMRLGDCATQRNLDETGRRESVALGARLREAGIHEARIFTSRWCRARDTATLLGFAPPAELPALDSFFGARGEAEARTAALRAFLADLPRGAPVLLVTHQVNITALTAMNPAQAEIIFVAAQAPHAVLGRLR